MDNIKWNVEWTLCKDADWIKLIQD